MYNFFNHLSDVYSESVLEIWFGDQSNLNKGEGK